MNRLWLRLSLAFLLMVWVCAGVIVLVVQAETESGFRQYLNRRDLAEVGPGLMQQLEDWYATYETWTGAEVLFALDPASTVLSITPTPTGEVVEPPDQSGLPAPLPGISGAVLEAFSNLTGGNPRRNTGTRPGWMPPGGMQSGMFGSTRRSVQLEIIDADGVTVVSTNPNSLGRIFPPDSLTEAVQLQVAGKPVGWVYRPVAESSPSLGLDEAAFLGEVNRALILAGGLSSVLAVVAGNLLAWTLARPLRHLTDGVRQLTTGQPGHQVEVSGTQETRTLAAAFNQLSEQLAKGEALRRRMAADIAHELRTPVSVLRVHLEAMLDGVFPLDQQRLAVACDQTIYLGRLVEDLRVLTLAEAGHLPLERAPLAVDELAREMIDLFEPLALDAGVHLRFVPLPGATPVYIQGDRMRLRQALGNLLTNALQHTPPDGEIVLRVELDPPGTATDRQAPRVRFAISNTGSRLSPEEVELVFQPFWRAQEARDHNNGGSGLGLAIAQQFMALHHGRLWAQSDPNRVTFVAELPAAWSPAGG